MYADLMLKLAVFAVAFCNSIVERVELPLVVCVLCNEVFMLALQSSQLAVQTGDGAVVALDNGTLGLDIVGLFPYQAVLVGDSVLQC